MRTCVAQHLRPSLELGAARELAEAHRLLVGRGRGCQLVERSLPGPFVALGLTRAHGHQEHRVRVDPGVGERLLLGRDCGVVADDGARTAAPSDFGEVLLGLDHRTVPALDLVARVGTNRTRRHCRLDARELHAPLGRVEVDVDAIADLGPLTRQRDVGVDELREVQRLRDRLGLQRGDQRLDAGRRSSPNA